VPNDECADASVVSSFPYSVSESNTGAFPGLTDDVCNINAGGRGLWYKIVVPDPVIFTIVMSSQTFSGSFALYQGRSCAELVCLQPVNDYSRNIETKALLASDETGSTFFVVVSGEDDTEYGSMELDVKVNEKFCLCCLLCCCLHISEQS